MMILPTRDPWVHHLLGDQNFLSRKGFLPWWYHLTSPPEMANPTLKQRDLARRSKILSALAFFLALTLMMVAYVALTGPNKQIITTVYILYPTIALCLLLNRFGHVHLAGGLLTFALVGGMYLTIFTTAFLRGGLTPNDKDILYLPFFGEMVAAALLPTAALFLIAVLNMVVSLACLYALPHTAAFSTMLVMGASSITFRIIEIHVFVSLVLWIVVTWTQIAVKRADRAAEIARLSHDLQVAANETIAHQQRLEQSIRQIIAVHMEVANGNLDARVSLEHEGSNILWQIAVPLNNLLKRHQQAVQEASEREAYAKILNQLAQDYPVIREQAGLSLRQLQSLYRQRSSVSRH